MVHEDQPLNHGDIPSELYQLEQLATRFELPTNSLLKNQGDTMCLDPTEEVLQSLGSQNLDFLAKEEIDHTLCILQENRHKLAPHLGSRDQENSNFARLKRCVMMLTIFTLLLTLSNFCISMVATQVSNDPTGSSGRWGSVSLDNGNVRASTTPKHAVVRMNPIEKETSTRHLKEVEEAACHQEKYAADYAGTDWETAGSNGTTVFCEAVGSVDYDDATRLYQAFCPQYPDITDASACANIGLSEVVLQCGASLTRILGGAYFPTAGTPGWDESETSFVFPTPTKLVDNPGSLYFHGLQLVTEPSPNADSLFVDGPTFAPPELCEESIQFKLYCVPTQEDVEGRTSGTCFFLATYPSGSPNCPGGQVKLCRPPPSTIPSR